MIHRLYSSIWTIATASNKKSNKIWRHLKEFLIRWISLLLTSTKLSQLSRRMIPRISIIFNIKELRNHGDNNLDSSHSFINRERGKLLNNTDTKDWTLYIIWDRCLKWFICLILKNRYLWRRRLWVRRDYHKDFHLVKPRMDVFTWPAAS